MKTLPEEVLKAFDCDSVTVIITKAPHRKRIDLSKISLAEAKDLHSKGFLPMLKPKSEEKPVAAVEAKKKSGDRRSGQE